MLIFGQNLPGNIGVAVKMALGSFYYVAFLGIFYRLSPTFALW
jgi:hypothetical protein